MNNDDLQQFMGYIGSFSDFLFHLSPFQFSLLGGIIGLLASEALTINQQNSLGNFLEEVGQIMLTFNAQAETLNSYKNNSYQDQINDLRNRINMFYQNMKK